MSVLEIVLGVILVLAALFLVVAIILTEGKKHGLSGAISGGAETFFGKEKSKDVNKVLSKATTIVAIVFAALVFVTYLFSGIMH